VVCICCSFVGLFYGYLTQLPPFYWPVLQMLSMSTNMIGRVPQIYANFSASSTGQLSLPTFLLNFLGSVARVFTTLQDAGNDVVMVSNFALAAALNGALVLQILVYGNADQVKRD
jgi:mannose-P-dolichol utilization defect protein 1